MLFTDCELRQKKKKKRKSFKSDLQSKSEGHCLMCTSSVTWANRATAFAPQDVDSNTGRQLTCRSSGRGHHLLENRRNTFPGEPCQDIYVNSKLMVQTQVTSCLHGAYVPEQDTESHYVSIREEKIKVTLDKSFC